jgi:sulfatase modifying factor 1
MASRFLAALVALVMPLTVCAADGESRPNGHVLIRVSGGLYSVGEKGDRFNPARRVRLAAYFIADAETSNAQFAEFVRATGYVTDAERRGFGMVFEEGMRDWQWIPVNGAHWRKPMGPDGPKAEDLPEHPVTQISGADAAAYCRWLGARLPTLVEWEVAARAGATTRWPWGDEFITGRANIWNGENHEKETPGDGYTYTAPVRSYPPNAWGLYDVIGNVFEYCADLPAVLHGRESKLVSARGGSWWCSANTCCSYNLIDIGRMERHGSLSNQGFRVAFDIPKSRESKRSRP